MKRGRETLSGFIILALALAIAFTLPLVSTQPTCSNDTEVSQSTKEVNTGSRRNVNGLGIATSRADEISVYNRITADLIIDAEHLSLTNQTSPQEIELLIGEYTVNLIRTEASTATIDIDGSSEEITEGEIETIKGLEVALTKVEHSDNIEEISAEILIGSQQLSLSNDENPSEKVIVEGKSFIIDLISASDSSATVRVSKCATGEIIEESSDETQEDTNVTDSPDNNQTTDINNTEGNITEVDANDTEPIDANDTISNVTDKIDQNKEIGEACQEDLECESDSCVSGQCEKPGFFKRILNWFKGLFG